MGSRNKRRARQIVIDRNFQQLASLIRDDRRILRTLFSITYDPDPLVQWRAIEAIGKAAALLDPMDTEKIRIFIRGLFWLMNDESGGLGWRAPEVIGEVLYNVPHLIAEFGQLMASYTRESPFEAGSHVALARLAAIRPTLAKTHRSLLTEALSDRDPVIRAHAAMALTAAEIPLAPEPAAILAADLTGLEVYNHATGELDTMTVAGAIGRTNLSVARRSNETADPTPIDKKR